MPDLLLGVFLDFIIGDPRGFPHPVKGIGWLIVKFEGIFRHRLKNPYWEGGITLLLVLSISLGVVSGTIWAASWFGELSRHLAVIFWFYSAVSAKGLAGAAKRVYQSLSENNLDAARKHVSSLVGRDTNALSQEQVSMATIESLAENSVDGIIAPLFWGVLGGPVGIWFYKAVNTADSMIGYKNPKYRAFGCLAARLDDLVNLIPARLCYLIFPVAAAILYKSGCASFCQAWQNAPRHKSPNAGIPEGAIAGALNIRLGGPDYQGGVKRNRAFINSDGNSAGSSHILLSIRMMWVAAWLSLALFILLSVHG